MKGIRVRWFWREWGIERLVLGRYVWIGFGPLVITFRRA